MFLSMMLLRRIGKFDILLLHTTVYFHVDCTVVENIMWQKFSTGTGVETHVAPLEGLTEHFWRAEGLVTCYDYWRSLLSVDE